MGCLPSIKLFKVKPEGFTPFLLGRGGTQDLVHVLNFASTMDQLKDKKMVFVLSPQWFVPQGIDETHLHLTFQSNKVTTSFSTMM